MADLRNYKGKPIIDRVPEYTDLRKDGLGEEIASGVNSQYAGTPAELTSNPNECESFRESNTFKLFAVDFVARDLGWRVMLPEEAQLLLDINQMPERTLTYKDLGLAMDFSGRNHDLAVDLYSRLTQEERSFDRFPAVFTGLQPVKSDAMRYGLAFEVMPYTQMRTAKILNSPQGNFDNEDPELQRTGLPSRLGKGNRKLYTLNQNNPSLDSLGVVGFYLNRDSGLSSDNGFLDDSYEGGRVVLVSGEATSQKISQYVISLKRQREELEARLGDIQKAEAMMRENKQI